MHVATLPVRQESRDDPEALVHLDPPDLPDHRVSQANQDRLEPQETLEFQANLGCPYLPGLLQLRLLVSAGATMELSPDCKVMSMSMSRSRAGCNSKMPMP